MGTSAIALMGGGMKQATDIQSAVERVKVRILPDGRMSRADAALYLGHQPKTQAMWALQGKGPRSVKVGGRVFYFKDELDVFIGGKPTA